MLCKVQEGEVSRCSFLLDLASGGSEHVDRASSFERDLVVHIDQGSFHFEPLLALAPLPPLSRSSNTGGNSGQQQHSFVLAFILAWLLSAGWGTGGTSHACAFEPLHEKRHTRAWPWHAPAHVPDFYRETHA